MRTYIIEDSLSLVLGYYKTLTKAKYSLEKIIRDGFPRSELMITMIQGQYFGKGFKKYSLMLNNNNKYVKEKI